MLFIFNDSSALFTSNIMHFGFCLFLIAYMRYNLENQNNSNSRFMFKRFIRSTIWALIADMASYLIDSQRFFADRFVNHVSMILSVFLTAYVGYMLNTFFDAVFHIKDNQKQRKRIYMIPVALVTVLLFINLFNGCLYSIDENNVYTRGPLSLISFFLQYVAFAVVALRAVFFKYPVKTLRYLRLRNSFVLVGVLTLFFGTMQIISQGKIAFQCLGVTAGIFILFSRFQEDQITNDILTGLNNRHALDAYITDKMKVYHDGAHGGESLYLIMMDVNFFKRINDNYGHVEGDKALKTVAKTLKHVGEKYGKSLFIARFGGDEFSAVFESNSEKKVLLLCDEIKKTLEEETKEFKYLLTIGTGYAVYTGSAMSIVSFYDRADKALYEDKDRIKNSK